MITESVTYTDFNGETCTDTLYFNISKTDLADNIDMQQELEAIQKIFQGPKRDIVVEEIRQILEFVKRVMRISYGERSADGKRFRKSPEIWADFQSTAAYDEFLFSLFKDPEKANRFIIGVFPQDLIKEAREVQRQQLEGQITVTEGEITETPASPGVLDLTPRDDSSPIEFSADPNSKPEDLDDRPAWIKQNRPPTTAELQSMSREQLLEVTRMKVQSQQ